MHLGGHGRGCVWTMRTLGLQKWPQQHLHQSPAFHCFHLPSGRRGPQGWVDLCDAGGQGDGRFQVWTKGGPSSQPCALSLVSASCLSVSAPLSLSGSLPISLSVSLSLPLSLPQPALGAQCQVVRKPLGCPGGPAGTPRLPALIAWCSQTTAAVPPETRGQLGWWPCSPVWSQALRWHWEHRALDPTQLRKEMGKEFREFAGSGWEERGWRGSGGAEVPDCSLLPGSLNSARAHSMFMIRKNIF